jgi:hypothetical protein
MSLTPTQARIRQAQGQISGAAGSTTLSAKIASSVGKVLGAWGAVVAPANGVGAGALGLETFGEVVPQRNAAFSGAEADVTVLLRELGELKVPGRHVEVVAEQCLVMFDAPNQNIQKIVTNGGYDTTKTYAPLASIIGRSSAAQMQGAPDPAGMEAFGEDSNRLPTDDRLTMNLIIMRPWDNIMDKGLARVNESSPVVTIRTPSPQAYDWATTQNASSIDARHTNYSLRDLYRNPSPVNSQAKRIIPVAANDTKSVLWNTTDKGLGLYKTNVDISLMDLSKNSAVVGSDHVDRTDLVADGGTVDKVIVTITDPNGGTPKTESFVMNTRSLDLAMFARSPSSKSSGQQQLMMTFNLPITSATTQWDGSASTIAAKLTDAKINVKIQLNATLNILTGALQASGTANLALVAKAGSTISNATQTTFGSLNASLSAYSVETYFNEENQRKANLAIYVNYYEQQFIIPRSRVYFTEYSLTQDADTNAVTATSSIMALGNGRRGLGIIVNALADISETLKFASENPEIAMNNALDDQSLAGALVKPTVITTELDFEDEELNTMNESTRLTEMHGRFRARILNMLSMLFAKSLMLNQYKGGETPVIKIWTHSTIADLIIGVTDYHPDLQDRATTATGADYSMTLPNGYRLDVIKSNLDCLQGRLFAVPVIESDMGSILSAASIRDMGTVSTNYMPSNHNAVTKRVATTTREIVMMSNKVGVCMVIKGLQFQVGPSGFAKIDLNADASESFAS